jgi:hypothetical protein
MVPAANLPRVKRNNRRRALREELESLLNVASRKGGESIVTLLSMVYRSAQLLKTTYQQEPSDKSYLNLIHAAELFMAGDLYLRKFSIKAATGRALLWRTDPRCPAIDETIILEEDLPRKGE